MVERKYDISILILTYNPKWEKLKSTVVSALLQKNLKFEIIVSDDGSQNNYFNKLKELFNEYSFYDYKMLSTDINQGTVKNLNRALLAAEGDYIRDISPGDYLFSDNSLSKWLYFVKKNKIDVCFGNAVYYNDDNGLRILKHITNPKLKFMYKKRNEKDLRWEYILMEDHALGAAFLAKKNILLKYNTMMLNKVKLCEDYAYRLMLFDHISIYLYDELVVWYEYGHGVSTCNKIRFNKVLKDDSDATDDILLTLEAKKNVDKKYQKYLILYKKIENKRFLLWLIWLLLFPKMFLWRLQMIFKKTYSEINVDLNFFNKINE